MANQKNDYYSATIEELLSNKDSILEFAKVLEYDKERLVARIYTLVSKRYHDDVPVFFPSMYLNTGIISPPAINSTSLVYWGSDRQPYLLPVQFQIPNIRVENGITKLNASPSFIDDLLSLKSIQSGEHLFRSLGGAYIFLKNLGEVEIGTSRLHRVFLSPQDGSFNAVVEKFKAQVNNSEFYFGSSPLNPNATHYKLEMTETANETDQLGEIDDQTLLDNVMNDNMDSVELVPPTKVFTHQMGQVISNDSIEKDEIDGTQLFSKESLNKDGVESTETLSFGGRRVFKVKKKNRITQAEVTPDEVQLTVENVVNGVVNISSIGINAQGNIICSKNGKQFDLWPVLKWFYEERTV